MAILETQVVDPSQFDPTSPYYDPKSTPADPRWHTVRVQFLAAFERVIPLAKLRATFTPEELEWCGGGTPVGDTCGCRGCGALAPHWQTSPLDLG
jgi:predicted RNA-binding protein with PUA-like domain